MFARERIVYESFEFADPGFGDLPLFGSKDENVVCGIGKVTEEIGALVHE